MKKLYIIMCLAGALYAPAARAAYDGTVHIDRISPNFSGGGGEFTMNVTSGLASILSGLPGDLSSPAGTWESFCIEESEFVNIPGNYNANINSGAIQGGGEAVSGFDALSIGTAYLYSQFRAGTLAGYSYGAGRAASAGALQDAIWFLEGEGGANNSFVALAIANVTGNTLAAAKGNANGAYDVVVLNLYDSNNAFAQDQLGMVPTGTTTSVPEPSTMFAGALLLLPFAAGTIRSLRKSRVA